MLMAVTAWPMFLMTLALAGISSLLPNIWGKLHMYFVIRLA